MKWSWKIAQVAGIGIFVHWTFLILIAWLIGIHWMHGSTIAVTLEGIGFVLAIFVCVVLHELGHALAARRYNVQTRDITLLPIGGVARLERMPEHPWQEFVIAIAGPLVNVAIALVLLILSAALVGLKGVSQLEMIGGDLLTKLMFVNVALVVFNLLPAFPMDGGRILRALLASRMDYPRATQYAATVGQGMAILFGVFGLFFNWFLLFIALFVFLGAQQEAYAAQANSLLKGVPVREAMVTRFQTLPHDASLQTALDALLAGDQYDFPVMDGERIAGILTRKDLFEALAQQRFDSRVADLMHPPSSTLSETEMLDAAFRHMQEAGLHVVPVVRDNRLVGLLNLENIGEWMMIRSYFSRADTRSSFDNILELRPDKPHGRPM